MMALFNRFINDSHFVNVLIVMSKCFTRQKYISRINEPAKLDGGRLVGLYETAIRDNIRDDYKLPYSFAYLRVYLHPGVKSIYDRYVFVITYGTDYRNKDVVNTKHIYGPVGYEQMVDTITAINKSIVDDVTSQAVNSFITTIKSKDYVKSDA